MLLIAAAIRLASPPLPRTARFSIVSALLLSVFTMALTVCLCGTRAHVYLHTRIAAVPRSTQPPAADPRQATLLESRACMLMIARHGLYLFHLICAPSGHGSCNDAGERRAGWRKEGSRGEGWTRPRPPQRDEIFALSPAKYCGCASTVLRAERRKRE